MIHTSYFSSFFSSYFYYTFPFFFFLSLSLSISSVTFLSLALFLSHVFLDSILCCFFPLDILVKRIFISIILASEQTNDRKRELFPLFQSLFLIFSKEIFQERGGGETGRKRFQESLYSLVM